MAWDEENDINDLQGRRESRRAVFDMAGRPGESTGLEGRRQERAQGRVSGLYRGGVDRHAAAQPAAAHGGDGASTRSPDAASFGSGRYERRHPSSNAWRRVVIPLSLGCARTRVSKRYKRVSIGGMCTSSLPPRKAGRSSASGLTPRHAISVGPILKPRSGTVHLEGGLTLDYVKVRCIADIDLTTLAGQGHLEIVAA